MNTPIEIKKTIRFTEKSDRAIRNITSKTEPNYNYGVNQIIDRYERIMVACYPYNVTNEQLDMIRAVYENVSLCSNSELEYTAFRETVTRFYNRNQTENLKLLATINKLTYRQVMAIFWKLGK